MDDIRDRIEELISELKKERDELRVKVHLARMGASDEWHRVEAKLEKLEAKAIELGGTTAEASKDIAAAAKLLGEEIRKGLKAVARRL